MEERNLQRRTGSARNVSVSDVLEFCEDRVSMIKTALDGGDESVLMHKTLFHERAGTLKGLQDVIDFIEKSE